MILTGKLKYQHRRKHKSQQVSPDGKTKGKCRQKRKYRHRKLTGNLNKVSQEQKFEVSAGKSFINGKFKGNYIGLKFYQHRSLTGNSKETINVKFKGKYQQEIQGKLSMGSSF